MTRPPSAPPDRLRLDDQLCFALYSASRAVVRAYAPILSPLGLTYPQYLVMIALWEATTPLTVGDLGRRLQLDTGTLTPLLKRMEQLGLVDRTRDRADERRVLVEPTDAGAALEARACAVPGLIAAAYAGPDGTPERTLEWIAGLRDQLGRLVAALEPPGPDGAGQA